MKNKKPLQHLYTAQGEDLTGQPWVAYPRPQLRRDSFFCLNGEWKFSADGILQDARILVPFAPESLLSGVHCDMGERPVLHYQKSFTLPQGFLKDRVLLHFGAVDQIASVTLNGQHVGDHIGGYEAFCFDITSFLKEGENLLEVCATDELETKILPWGKQKRKRGGMWYTPVSGIWQTVWLESVPSRFVRALRICTGLDFAEITAEGIEEGVLTLQTPAGEKRFALQNGFVRISLEEPRLWSPEDPYLYVFTLESGEDRVES